MNGRVGVFSRASGSHGGERLDFCHFGPCACHVCVGLLHTLIESHKESNGLEVVSAERAMRAQPGVDGSR